MKRVTTSAGAMLAFVASACTMADQAPPTAVQGGASAGATAELIDASGRKVGTATASQAGSGIRIRLETMGLPGGAHGAHVHMTGACTPPGFESAGGHWNPTTRQHGKDNPAGLHKGDLPNVVVGADGRGTAEYAIADASVTGGSAALLDEDGAAIVVHAQADDYRTDPSGNSGGRIACGVFR